VIAKLKLYFDVCCSKKLPRELLEFYKTDYPGLETRHHSEDWDANTADPVWLDALKAEGWMPITCDQGKDKKTESLPLICKNKQLTHIVFSSTLLRKGATAQKNAIIHVWEQIFFLDKYPPGTQVKLGEKGGKEGAPPKYVLIPKLISN